MKKKKETLIKKEIIEWLSSNNDSLDSLVNRISGVISSQLTRDVIYKIKNSPSDANVRLIIRRLFDKK